MRATPFVADLHIHSRYSRACSRDCDLRAPGLVGRAQGHRACSAPATSRHPAWYEQIRTKLVPAEPGLFRLRAGPGAGRRCATLPALGAGAGAVPAVGGDLHDLQAGRPDPQGAPPDLPARPRTRRPSSTRRLGPDRQPRLRRPADPRARLPRPAGDHAGGEPGRLPGAGAHLDALVLRARLEVRLRRDRRLLRRPGRAHLRGRDRAVAPTRR